MADIIIGIDFGNINSFPAYVHGIDPDTNKGGVEVTLLPSQSYKVGIPSMFHINKNGEWTFGEPATRGMPRKNCRNMLKRKLDMSESFDGTDIKYNDVITGMIQHVITVANDELEKDYRVRTSKIMLAYPVTFSLAQKERLRELAQKATVEIVEDGNRVSKNVEVVGMIQEPAAAALEYLGSLPNQNTARDFSVLVYDLGGGTFDASVVTAHQKADGSIEYYEVIDQAGSKRAGNEFTEALLNLINQKLKGLGCDLPESDSQKDTQRREAEKLKIDLSEVESVIYVDPDDNEVEITRSELEQATKDLIDETINVSTTLFNRCEIKPDMIIMTGGQSQMPVIKTRLISAFSSIRSENIIIYNPQRSIAFGAARFGALSNNPTPVPPVRLRTGRMLGLARVVDDSTPNKEYVYELIPRNTELPMTEPVTHIFHPTFPCRKHTITLSEAISENPDIYNSSHFRQIVSVTIDFHLLIPDRPDFEVAVIIDRWNKIHFSARDPKGKFGEFTAEEVTFMNVDEG